MPLTIFSLPKKREAPMSAMSNPRPMNMNPTSEQPETSEKPPPHTTVNA